jgi:hypothetical protein
MNSTEQGSIPTASFAPKCRLLTTWPVTSWCRLTLSVVRLADLPADLVDILKAHGLSDWLRLASPEDDVILGEAVILQSFMPTILGPAPTYPVGETIRWTKELISPLATRLEDERLARERAERLMDEEQKAAEARLLRERQAQEAKAEAERRRNPTYLAGIVAKLERTVQSLLDTGGGG